MASRFKRGMNLRGGDLVAGTRLLRRGGNGHRSEIPETVGQLPVRAQECLGGLFVPGLTCTFAALLAFRIHQTGMSRNLC